MNALEQHRMPSLVEARSSLQRHRPCHRVCKHRTMVVRDCSSCNLQMHAAAPVPQVLKSGHLQVCVRSASENEGSAPVSGPTNKLQSSLLERSMPDKKVIDQAETEIAGLCCVRITAFGSMRTAAIHASAAVVMLEESQSGCLIYP